jgi:hypothetical protein
MQKIPNTVQRFRISLYNNIFHQRPYPKESIIPTITSRESKNEICQLLTDLEEPALVNQLLFLDEFNVLADQVIVYDLVYGLLHQCQPGLGRI